ncbi:class I SAM-dependent methyltransferase [Polynucleobacter asymbioticus]|jgi:SAM-dependent methyltransferase|uniref:class I SAM-dependent methyltransferase n=1 Tax=Polynucleobacter asymbioticus TaxID=576611 RepID=UPI0008F7EE29|nr:methyltransferase domain-containing protein [Polynucleobacter asymbioticus]
MKKEYYTTAFKSYFINLSKKFSIYLLKDKFIRNYSKQVAKVYSGRPVFINIGAGDFYHPWWINLDNPNFFYKSVQNKNMLVHDLALSGDFPITTKSVDTYYCSHVIEHLNDIAVKKMFSEIYRTLKPGGAVRIVCPNMEYLYEQFRDGDTSIVTQLRPWGVKYSSNHLSFLEHFCTLLVHSDDIQCRVKCDEALFYQRLNSMPIESFFNSYIEDLPIDSNKRMPQGHCNWFTFKKLVDLMHEVGFSNISKSSFLQSKRVELRAPTLFDSTSPEISLYVEAVK